MPRKMAGTGKMAQQLRAFAADTDSLSLTPRTTWWKEQMLQVILSHDLYTSTMAHACTQKFMCMCTCKIFNVKKEEKEMSFLL